jgi:hypothetical protein
VFKLKPVYFWSFDFDNFKVGSHGPLQDFPNHGTKSFFHQVKLKQKEIVSCSGLVSLTHDHFSQPLYIGPTKP